MKYIVIAAATVALAACSKPAPAPDATTEAATETPAETATVANGSPAGAYEVTAKDGSVRTATLNADGTYEDTDATGKVLEEGTWAVKDGKDLLRRRRRGRRSDVLGREAAPGADGSFTATSADGRAIRLSRPSRTAPLRQRLLNTSPLPGASGLARLPTAGPPACSPARPADIDSGTIRRRTRPTRRPPRARHSS